MGTEKANEKTLEELRLENMLKFNLLALYSTPEEIALIKNKIAEIEAHYNDVIQVLEKYAYTYIGCKKPYDENLHENVLALSSFIKNNSLNDLTNLDYEYIVSLKLEISTALDSVPAEDSR